MKAFLFHHAGGDKYAFRKMEQQLLPQIKCTAVEYPGRSDRYSEPFAKDVFEIQNDIFNSIKKELQEPYIFIGISMGTLVGFLVIQKILEAKLPLPKHIFFASRNAPYSYVNDKKYSYKSSEDFWNEVLKYDGIPKEFLQNKELLEFYEPIVKSDFEILENYNLNPKIYPKLNINTTILVGKTDRNVTLESANSWQENFMNTIDFELFDGGHFFLYENEKVVESIKNKIFNNV